MELGKDVLEVVEGMSRKIVCRLWRCVGNQGFGVKVQCLEGRKRISSLMWYGKLLSSFYLLLEGCGGDIL